MDLSNVSTRFWTNATHPNCERLCIPEPLAVQLLRSVASRDRSRFVSEALAARLEERKIALIRACEIANQDLDVAEIEREFDGIGGRMAEPWK